MAVSVLSAARAIGKRSDWTLSNLELQKIIYLAHMFYLGRTDGLALVFGQFEAWDYGPVHPELYRRARIFGSDPVQDIFDQSPFPQGAEKVILDEAFDSLGSAGPGRLVNATHRKGGAWETHYAPGVRHCAIPNQDILAEYLALDGGADNAEAP
jgi:uncharacterized phage-associated protein